MVERSRRSRPAGRSYCTDRRAGAALAPCHRRLITADRFRAHGAGMSRIAPCRDSAEIYGTLIGASRSVSIAPFCGCADRGLPGARARRSHLPLARYGKVSLYAGLPPANCRDRLRSVPAFFLSRRERRPDDSHSTVSATRSATIELCTDGARPSIRGCEGRRKSVIAAERCREGGVALRNRRQKG
jgi:hypothetical protein